MKLVFVVLLVPVCLFAIDPNAGTAGYQFLKINFDARSSSLGEIVSPIWGSPGSVIANPSAMSFEKKRGVVGNFGLLYAGINGGSAGIYTPIRDNVRIGSFLSFISYGDMDKTNENGEKIGTFSAQSIVLGLAVSRPVENDISVSARLNFIYDGIDNYNSIGFGLDLSGIVKLSKGRASVGITARNLGFQLKGFTKEHKDKLPVLFAAGASLLPKGLPFRVFTEATKAIDEPFRGKFGLEVIELRPLYLRAGYTLREKTKSPAFKDEENLNGFSFGAGIELRESGLFFDYAFSSFGALGSTHKFNLAYNKF